MGEVVIKQVKDIFPPLELPIFDTKIEPCNSFLRQEEFRTEILQNLQKQNLDWMYLRIISDTKPFDSLNECTLTTTRHLCDYFELSNKTYFLALELFDRFVMRLSYAFYRALNKMKRTTKSMRLRKEKCDAMLETITDQSTLRLLSTIQIASKIYDRDMILTTKMIADYLKESGEATNDLTLNQIVLSEMRILKLLGYKVNVPTIHVCLETLLGQRESPQLIAIAPQVFSIAEQMCHMLYSKHRAIYDQLFTLMEIPPLKERSFRDRKTALEIELDNIWAAAAVIIASVHFADSNLQDLAIRELAKDLKEFHDKNQIQTFAWLLMKFFTKELHNKFSK